MFKALFTSFKKGIIPTIAIVILIEIIFKLIELAIYYSIIRYIIYIGLGFLLICLVGFIADDMKK